ncbi:spermidine synthase [Paenibacillus piri]|uniref:Spermidine synthase n=1 Tax=Paenibacillus piri TaxID=2547395 RepID=A0A4R5KF95_9BACL|nr:fused MFS/spermidine synthase [Paenibacillus piri]TDF94041.1 spermidine synthase [Paenibacillus piri]
MQLLAKEFSRIHEIAVYETSQLYGQLGKYRFLQFSDHAVQGAMDMNDPKRIVLEYPRAIIHCMEHNNPAFEHVFVIGHGIGTISGHYPQKRFKVAEIDETVAELSRAFFQYGKDDIVIGDGRLILQDEQPGTLDYIIVDAFTRKGTPTHLTSLQFFDITRQKLNPRGAIILNLTGKIKNDKHINAIYTTLKESYACTRAFSLPGEAASDIRNIIIIGSSRTTDFQPRQMAEFIEIELEPGYVITDQTPYPPARR